MRPVFFFIFLVTFFTAAAREKKTLYYPSGKLQYEYEMEGHLFDGKFASYFETGKLRIKGQFINNQKAGLWRVWDENGLLRSERNYSNNKNFTILSETDSSGVKIRRDIRQVNLESKETDVILFNHRYISSIGKTSEVNKELFVEMGLIDQLMGRIMKGELISFSDDRFTLPLNVATNSCYTYNDVTAILVKEDYTCNVSNQTMLNRVLGICPVIMDKGKQKLLGWVYVPDLKFETKQLNNIKDNLYESSFIKTTVNDPSFKFRDVKADENDMLRLMLLEFEANAILYTIDQQMLASN